MNTPTRGGRRSGAGRPANIALNVARLERSIAAERRRPTLRYAEAEALRARIDDAAEAMEHIVVATPDYPE